MSERSRIVAGGTDYVIASRRSGAVPDVLLYPGEIAALHEITLTDTQLRIGAVATMAELAAALCDCPEFRAIADAAAHVGSPQIRNRATIAGNLCNASPAGDILPIAALYDARLEVMRPDGTLDLRPYSAVVCGAKKTTLAYNELVTAVLLERTASACGAVSAFRKIGSREYVSIARESIAVRLCRAADGAITDARVALGAVSDVPLRVSEAEAILRAGGLSEEAAFAESIARAVEGHCRPANRVYKTEASRGMCADVLAALRERME